MKLGRRLARLLLGAAWVVGCEQKSVSSTDAHTEHAELAPKAANGDPHAEHRGGEGEMAPGNPPPGYAPFTIDSETARAVGLRVASVREQPFIKGIRTTGVVVVDETRTSHVHTKVRGWVESVSVDFVGKSVARGAPLCSIYSQEVFAAQLEFLSVLDQVSRTSELSGPFATAEKQAREQLLSAARRRLALWDVPAAEIERLERTREPQRTFTLRAPRSGIVVAKQAVAGMYVDPAVELYLISDIDKLWVLADIYESDVAGVKVGDRAEVSIAGLAAPIPAEVAFLPPTLEEATRTLKVRFNLENPEGRIRPGAFATVELNLEGGPSLAVPEDAVIHAGPRAIVFVVSGERIEPRSVTLGPLVAGFYSVHAGLEANEAVAVGAQFLIDSESRLRATTGEGPSHAGH
ncbi:MAG TPA: efflux RND transporter periplasmic adaptor subunit [Polyangiaceae bacterium]|nr:efflux RND transporter periplasmic adaptor subunit [Polyangiaceae bacterium]